MGKASTNSNSSSKSSPVVKAKKTEAKVAKKSSSPSSSSSSSEVKILEAMAKLLARGNETPERIMILSIVGIRAKTLANLVTKFKKDGVIELPDGKTMKLTDTGKERAEELGLMTSSGATNEEVHDRIREDDLKGKKRYIEMFDLLLDGEEHLKEDVANAMKFDKGKKTKGFQNLCGEMKKLNIVCYPTKDTLQLVVEVCFPFGK